MTSEQAPILKQYEELAQITGAMLNAAQAGDWENVLTHGQRYCESVERLRQVEEVAPLDDEGRMHKYDLLVRILENDALTRDLAIPQLARLGELLGRMKRQQSLLHAYGAKAPVA